MILGVEEILGRINHVFHGLEHRDLQARAQQAIHLRDGNAVQFMAALFVGQSGQKFIVSNPKPSPQQADAVVGEGNFQEEGAEEID